MGLRVPRWIFPISDELLQLPLFDESLDLLLKVVAFGGIVPMVLVEKTVFVSGSLVWVAIQLIRPS